MKKAIIVGASSGIGKALALFLADHGYKVGITGRRNELLVELQQQKPDQFIAKSFDVKDVHDIAEQLETLVYELGGLDLLILSSGTGNFNPNLDFDIEKDTIDTNVAGFTCVIDWAFNFFQTQQFGHLASISSIAGLRGGKAAPAYNASKAYQISYFEALRQKVHKLKMPIALTDIRPGFVATDMAKGPGQFWVASPEKAAQQILDAILQQQKVVYVTKRWRIIALLLKCIPRFLYDRM